MAINAALRNHQVEHSEVMTKDTLVEASPKETPFKGISWIENKSILTPTSGFLASGYGVRFWGMDKEGQPINSLLTCASARMARCAAAAALVELGARAHFCIASLKDKALPRLVTEFKALSAIQQAAPAEHACSSTRR